MLLTKSGSWGSGPTSDVVDLTLRQRLQLNGANPSNPAWVAWATSFTLRRSDGATTGDVRWGDTFQILMTGERANQVASFSSEATSSADMGHESWATRLWIRGASQVVQ